jgi:hypothetical protein
MVLLDLEPHVGHHGQHLGPEIVGAIDRRDREITALDRRAVAGIAVGELLVGNVRALLAVDLVERGVHAVLEAHVVEHEELGLGAEIRGVADAGRGEIGLGLLRRRARVAPVGLTGAGLVDVAEDDQLGLRREGIEHGGAAVRHQHHVALVDRLPAGDRRAVEHHAVGEEILGDRPDVMRKMLPLAARVGEAEIDILDVMLLDQRHDVLDGSCWHCFVSCDCFVVARNCRDRAAQPGRGRTPPLR